jgi:hypothetical protein
MPSYIPKSLFATAFVCATGWLLSSVAASAQTETFVSSSYLLSAAGPNDFSVPSFNSDLGTLQGVDITLMFNLCPEISIYNSTNAGVDFMNASINLPLEVTGPGAIDFSTSLDATDHCGEAKPGVTTRKLAAISTSGSEEVASNNLDLWENQPHELVSLAATLGDPTFQGTAHGSGLFFGGSSTEWGKITVEYTYASGILATPEPRGTYLTAIVGLAMVAIVLRRRKTPAGV